MTDCNQVNWCLEILKVMPTFIVGCIAAHISWQQSKTAKEQSQIAKAKLNLDLFIVDWRFLRRRGQMHLAL